MNNQDTLYRPNGALTLKRIIAIMMYCALLVAGIILGNPVINIAVIAVTVIALADLIKLHVSLAVRISAGNRTCFEGTAGKKIFIPITYKNRTPFRFPVCRFGIYDSNNTEADSPVFSIEPFRERNVYVEIDPQYCGLYTIELNKITVWDIFGLFCMKKRTNIGKCSLTVLPETITDRFPGLPKDDKPEDDDYQFRNYADGDNLRLVNWKKSAGSEELIVKEIIENRHPYDILLYNNSVTRRDAAFTDTLASCAATVAQLLGYRHREVRLSFTYSSERIAGLCSKDDGLEGIKRALACADFSEALQPEMPPEADGADSVYIITPGFPQNLARIINNPVLSEKNVYIFSLIDDSKEFAVPAEYSQAILLRYTLLRRGGGKVE